ncbi:MAG: Dabb family protein [Deltaproteobacteria bacterium]|nr:Dabb family protein [Deltaproteobacteria bacterium]MCB9786194.1 Dabb family protein [Deltaproteobacteria bacterium]
MITRIVLFKLDDAHASDAGRAAVVAEARRVMPEVAGVRAIEVGVPADAESLRSWDVSLIVRLDAVDALPAYQADAAHRAFVDQFLRPRLAAAKAWNFEAP